MNELSEEEILNRLGNLGYKYDLDNDDCDAVRKIQDMYKAEKEKIKELEKEIQSICEKEQDVEDYQCEEYYKIQALQELLEE